MTSQYRSTQGVTLIELLITMAVLAVLAAIAIPAYQGYIATSYRTECHNEAAAIRLAEEEYFLENSTYFVGGNIASLATNSGNIYEPSTPASNGTSHCTFAVVSSTPTTTYTLTAIGRGVKIPTTETVLTIVK